MTGHSNTKKAIFAAGCFWGIQDKFAKQDGVVKTRVGYIGGHVKNPDYEQVCHGQTGHAEAVEVTFDPATTDFDTLTRLFFSFHDPTQENRQGPDIGDQYRSEIFALDREQYDRARKLRENVNQNGPFANEVVTNITDASSLEFWEAEEYHQNYLEKNRGAG